MLYGLNAAWACWIVDILSVVVIIGYAIMAARRGFIDCIFSLVTTLLAFLGAILLMKSVVDWTDGLFGLQGVLEEGCGKALGKIKALNIDVSNAGLETSLKEQNLPQFLIDFVIRTVGDSAIPAGTTLAMVIGVPMGRLITSVIAFFVIFIVAKILLSLLKRVLSSVINKIPLVGGVNRILGFCVGILQGGLIICGIVAVLSLIPSDGLQNFFNDCLVLRVLYDYNLVNMIIGAILV